MTHKFDGPKNANYQHVRNVIEDLVSNAPTFVERDNGELNRPKTTSQY